MCMFGDGLMAFKFPPVVVSNAGAHGLLLMSRLRCGAAWTYLLAL